MYRSIALVIILLASATAAQAQTLLTLKDDNLPLEQISPEQCSDRQIYVVTLTGTWTKPPATGATHYVNFYFPNGYHHAHAVNSGDHEALFHNGQVKVMLVDYQLRRGGIARKGSVMVAVSHLRPAYVLNASNLISEPVTLQWPTYRPVKRGSVAPTVAPAPADRPKPVEPGEEKARKETEKQDSHASTTPRVA